MASTVCSERTVRGLACAALLAACSALPGNAQLRLAGSAGLWVQIDGDSAAVHWLTAQPTQGSLRVSYGTGEPLVMRTPTGTSHRAAFAIAGRDTVEVGVGRASADPDYSIRVGLHAPLRPGAEFPMPDTLFVFGDTHGAYDDLIDGMNAAGIIDDQLRWSAGRSHVVFAGDMADRGPDVLPLLWFLYGLEAQAAAAGGRLHVLLGNHEIMVMLGDLRYVNEKERFVAQLHGVSYDALFDRRTSLLGRWLASKPALIRIGDLLITHGGVVPEVARVSLDEFDTTLARHLQTARALNDTTPMTAADSALVAVHDEFFWDERSVFWHREYVRADSSRADSARADLERTLQLRNAQAMIIGHTAVPRIMALHGGRVIAAHTPRYGAELLMMVRADGELRRYRITPTGQPERF